MACVACLYPTPYVRGLVLNRTALASEQVKSAGLDAAPILAGRIGVEVSISRAD